MLFQIADLEGMAFELLKNFQKQTGKAPERVIFYRDGVSEGQFDQVARHEIAALKSECRTALGACETR